MEMPTDDGCEPLLEGISRRGNLILFFIVCVMRSLMQDWG